MPFNGSGVFSRVHSWVSDASAGLKISSTRMDADTNDIASALSNCICKDGQSVITGNIPLNGHKITGAADGSSSSDYVTYGQLLAGVGASMTALSSGSTTLTYAGFSAVYYIPSTSTSVEAILPLISTMSDGSRITFANLSGASATVYRQGADSIVSISGASPATSIVVGAGETLELVTDTSVWAVVGGSAMFNIGNYGILGGSYSSGKYYQKFPSGLIIQTTYGTTSAGLPTDLYWPVAFGFCLGAVATPENSTTDYQVNNTYIYSRITSSISAQFHVIGWGY